MASLHYFQPARQSTQEELRRYAKWVSLQARGVQLEMATGMGTFSRGALDEGSKLLLETATWPDEARVCDLGCGWGALGCFAAKFSPQSHVWLCDINPNAVGLTRLNIEKNGIANAVAWCDDGLTAARDEVFDTILCNPPVRAGNATIGQMFQDAQRCLISKGALWVVLRTQQGAKSWQKRLEEQFGNCETRAVAKGYRILHALKKD